MTHQIQLSLWEHFIAGVVGLARLTESSRRGTAKHIPMSGNPLEGKREQHDINSTGAEMAVGKLLNRYPHLSVNAIGDDKAPDVGERIEVRSTDRNRSLLVRERDPDDHFYFHVRGTIPTYEVVGWMRGSDAKQEKWRMNPHADGRCYLVPEEALHPVDIPVSDEEAIA